MAADSPLIPSVVAFRVLGPHERGRFSPEAWGHLLSLVGTGTVNGGELEHIIERALVQIDGPIALEDLRAFLDAAGLSGRPYPDSSQQSIH
jgi:Smg protein